MLDDLKHIQIADYDYPLPDERIARYPLAERDQSKMLCLRGADISEHRFNELPTLLPKDSLLVFNDTKVIHARLLFRKETGALIEVFCLEPYRMAVSEAFEQREQCSWVCMVGNNKKWKEGKLCGQWSVDGNQFVLSATRREAVGNTWIIDFNWTGGMSFAEVIEAAGVIPLPPYLGREAEESDATRYQTVYAHYEGSVAAPTAGLHFTPAVLDNEENLQHLAEHSGKPLVAVGTTSVRTLESLYWFGVKLCDKPDLESMSISQWDPYTLDDHGIGFAEAYNNVLQWMHLKGVSHLSGETQLMIAPGYRYRVINGMVTNFHQPKSTLLLLVSAFIGERWRDCYRFALDHGFRFLSYGDCCLFLK